MLSREKRFTSFSNEEVLLELQVEEAMSEEAKEKTSVVGLQRQLTTLQADVQAASQRLALTKARVDLNMRRVDELKTEAVRTRSVPVCHDLQS